MTVAADVGQSVAYSHMLAGAGLSMDAAHAAFEASLNETAAEPEPVRVMSTEEKRAALAAGMRANGQARAAAAMAGVL